MTVHTSEAPQLPAVADLEIAKPPSALRVSSPFDVTINHILGWLNGGLLHLQRAFAVQSATGTARMVVALHQNCDHVDVAIQLVTTGQAWQVVVTAGSGTARSLSAVYDISGDGGPSTLIFRAPYGAADTGAVEITVVTIGCSIQSMAVFAVPRETLALADGDDCLELIDDTYLRIGLIPERYIAASSDAGPPGMITSTEDCWDDYYTQLMSWWTWESAPKSSTAVSYGGAGSASDIFAGHTITARVRQKDSSQTRGTASYYFYAWTSDAGTTGEIQVSVTNPGAGANDSATIPAITSVAAWVKCSVEVDCTTDATVLCEFKRTGGAGTVYVSAVSAIGID